MSHQPDSNSNATPAAATLPGLPEPTPPIAFFDLDETLMRGFSAVVSGVYLLRQGRLNPVRVLLSFYHLARYRLQLADYDEILRDGLAPWVGRTQEELRAVSQECFQAVVRERLYQEGLELIAAYREHGARVTLVSSTSPFILREVRDFIGADDALATEFALEEGRLTGRRQGPAVYGEGKVVAARNHAEGLGVKLEQCAFYTDSASDLPLLRAVGHPFCVNPDRYLRRACEEHGWPLLLFHATLKEVAESRTSPS
jgi:HAD superfamily hydrolase (TIGR01490 family)